MIGRLAACMLAICACSTQGGSSQFNSDLNPPPTVTPPTIACTPDAGLEGDICSLPPSVCADDHWAAYFDDGTCIDGTCQLVTKYHYCTDGCASGACNSHRGTLPSRGF